MQQRRVRLGDILDDYCPRERRVTNHVVQAMIDDEVKQTRCSTCDSDHAYKQAKVPKRRKKAEGLAAAAPPAEVGRSRPEPVEADVPDDSPPPVATAAAPLVEAAAAPPPPMPDAADADTEPDDDRSEDEWPVHRPLIRATLPRPEGQVPERKATDFTVRHSTGVDGNRGGPYAHRGPRQGRPPQGQGFPPGQSRSAGGQRHGGGQGGQHPPRQGNRHGQPGGPRSGRPPGQDRGPRQDNGPGRRRGR